MSKNFFCTAYNWWVPIIPSDWSTVSRFFGLFSCMFRLYAAVILINQAAFIIGTPNSQRFVKISSFLLNVGTFRLSWLRGLAPDAKSLNQLSIFGRFWVVTYISGKLTQILAKLYKPWCLSNKEFQRKGVSPAKSRLTEKMQMADR